MRKLPKKLWRALRKRAFLIGDGMTLLFLLWYLCLPGSYFDDPLSVVVEDREGQLLGARIAADGQWRMSPSGEVPQKFREALVEFEDRRFYSHPGVDFGALGRALGQNLRSGEVVSGGSTLTMQTIRMMRGAGSRNLWNKTVEAFMATRLEWQLSKDDILGLYAANAPFGGNVVGLDAAAWRYYGRSPRNLSWAEAATLAVLPNSPGLIHPGRNRDALRAKRDRLLKRLFDKGAMDSSAYRLALGEPLPGEPHPLPNIAPHLTERLRLQRMREGRREQARFRTTLDAPLQQRVLDLMEKYKHRYAAGGIHNAAAVIVHVPTGEVRAYVGNLPGTGKEHDEAVDCARAPRSTGSILKPFLYAAMFDDGELLPHTLIPDVPSNFTGYRPVNFDGNFDGAVPADAALARSLNVPAVRLLHRYGQTRFYRKLKKLGLTTLRFKPGHYGLSLILGGAEATLYDIAQAYAFMARAASTGEQRYRPLRVLRDDPDPPYAEAPLSAAASYTVLESLQDAVRPGERADWQHFGSSRRIAWKTGTSYGYRDAWAVGCTPEYVVAVWTGNASGEGKPTLVGLHAAAPLMFDLFGLLPDRGSWFTPPREQMVKARTCRVSGHRATEHCPESDTLLIPLAGLRSPLCPYHKTLLLNADGSRRVHGDCESPARMQQKSWFILPPRIAGWYRKGHADYSDPPPWRDDCFAGLAENGEGSPVDILYPGGGATVRLARELDGLPGRMVMEAAHRRHNTELHWHLDKEFLGSTRENHQIAVRPRPGKHTLLIVDEDGLETKLSFVVQAD